MHGEHSWIGHSLEHSQAGQELSNIFRISVFSILNTLKNCAKLYQCANIAQDKGIALTLRNIAPKKKIFFWRNGFIAQAQTWRNPSAKYNCANL